MALAKDFDRLVQRPSDDEDEEMAGPAAAAIVTIGMDAAATAAAGEVSVEDIVFVWFFLEGKKNKVWGQFLLSDMVSDRSGLRSICG